MQLEAVIIHEGGMQNKNNECTNRDVKAVTMQFALGQIQMLVNFSITKYSMCYSGLIRMC